MPVDSAAPAAPAGSVVTHAPRFTLAEAEAIARDWFGVAGSLAALPHVGGVGGGGLTLSLGVSKKGVKFDDAGNMVNIVFFITIPTAVSAFYLRLMSGLTETFLKEQNREAILMAETPEQLWKALTKSTRYSIK